MHKIMPGRAVPDFTVTLADGTPWRLYDNRPDYMLMVDFYRGYHCPRCRTHLEELNAMADEFAKARIDILAVSMDPPERAALTAAEWQCDRIRVGHDLPIEQASELGLYLSSTIDIRPMEQRIFSEPAVYLIQSDFTLYGAVVQTFPFARPKIPELLAIPTFAADQKYPPRGDYLLEEHQSPRLKVAN